MSFDNQEVPDAADDSQSAEETVCDESGLTEAGDRLVTDFRSVAASIKVELMDNHLGARSGNIDLLEQ
jgi:hypothetical protein